MHSFSADPAPSTYRTQIHPVLTSAVDEVCGTLARLCAYLMALALIVIGVIAAWDRLPEAVAAEPAAKGGWSLAGRSAPSFAVSQFVFPGKTETYEIYRHPEGGRKDIFRWNGIGNAPVGELELYRPGGELQQPASLIDDLAAKMDPSGRRELETAGFIDSKFGPVTLFSLTGRDTGRACLAYLKRIDDPNLRISGWSCQGDSLPARRTAISCMLNRLILLTAGNEPKLAELFAHAELRRSDCASPAAPALSADWLTGSDNPRLRGAL